jgi:hypothetical protein
MHQLECMLSSKLRETKFVPCSRPRRHQRGIVFWGYKIFEKNLILFFGIYIICN